MNKSLVHYKHLAFFFYKKGKNSSQIADKICSVYGEGAVTKSTIQKWCARFKSSDVGLDNLEHLDDSSKVIVSKNQVLKDSIQSSNKSCDVLFFSESINKTGTSIDFKNKAHLIEKTDINPINPVCGWLTKDPVYIKYHNEEWGNPEYNSIKLFEMLCLEGQQAGLSWLTILKKRDHYRKLFFNFDPHKIAQLKSSDIDKYLLDPGIIRHRNKIEAIVHNAKCYIDMENNKENFSNFIWGFVNHSPVINNWKNNSDVPIQTETSMALSKALKIRGFKFVGSTTCYAFMQACGLVSDHITSCYIRTKTVIK